MTPAVTHQTVLRHPEGLRRSAVLMRALGANAASVWAQLSPSEAAQLTAAMQDMPEDQAEEEQVLRTYVSAMQSPPGDANDDVWARLSRYEGAAIVSIIQNESPQVIALILSKLSTDAAASAVRAMPRRLATDALQRLLNLGEVHPAVPETLAAILEQNIRSAQISEPSGGHAHVARIFDQMESQAEQDLLSSLDNAEPGSGEKIRALMFTFEDLATLDPASLQTILGNVDRAVLTIALKGATDAVSNAFFQNITQRAADLLREDIAATGPVRRSDIDTARTEILTIARTLVKRGDILTHDPDDELIA